MRRAEKAKADLIEVRLDCLEISRKLSELSKSTKIPLIATNKLQSEKGYFSGTETERQQTLLTPPKTVLNTLTLTYQAQTIKKQSSQLKQLGAKPIVSYHKFDGALSVSAMEQDS